MSTIIEKVDDLSHNTNPKKSNLYLKWLTGVAKIKNIQ